MLRTAGWGEAKFIQLQAFSFWFHLCLIHQSQCSQSPRVEEKAAFCLVCRYSAVPHGYDHRGRREECSSSACTQPWSVLPRGWLGAGRVCSWLSCQFASSLLCAAVLALCRSCSQFLVHGVTAHLPRAAGGAGEAPGLPREFPAANLRLFHCK